MITRTLVECDTATVDYALVNFMPHTPGGDLTLLFAPTPGAIDSFQFTDRFLVVAFLNNKIALAIILLATGVYQAITSCMHEVYA